MGRRSVLGLYAGSGQDRMNSENKPLAGMYARMYAYVCMYVCMGSEFFFYLVGMGRRSVLGLYAGSGQDRMNSENKPLAGMYARMYACIYVCMYGEQNFFLFGWHGTAGGYHVP